MFLIAALTGVVLGCGFTALGVVLVARLIAGVWLRYSSALKAVVAAYVATATAFVFTAYVGDLRLTRLLATDFASGAIVLLQMLALAWGISRFCSIQDGQRLGRPAVVVAVAVATTLITTAMGWAAFRPEFSLSESSIAIRARSSDEGPQLSTRSALCLRNLSLTLSDTGNGQNANEAQAYRQRLEQEARAKGIGLEQVLKSELSKFGSQVPFGCEHVR